MIVINSDLLNATLKLLINYYIVLGIHKHTQKMLIPN
jgi:hypothetical protein